MANIQGFSRDQVSFQLVSLDEIIDKENLVRAIDAFVESLDVKELQFKEFEKHNRGQQP
jgi:transposase